MLEKTSPLMVSLEEIVGVSGTVAIPSDSFASRIKFSLLEPLTLTLNLDFQTIAEIVKFDSGGVSVIGSVEYGDRLQVELTPGRYGLSFFVEGDLISYSVNGQFSAIDS